MNTRKAMEDNMNINKLDKVYRINKALTICSAINSISLGLVLMMLLFFTPIMPNGFIYGKTPFLQYITFQTNPLLFLFIIVILFIIFIISKVIKIWIKHKNKNILL